MEKEIKELTLLLLYLTEKGTKQAEELSKKYNIEQKIDG